MKTSASLLLLYMYFFFLILLLHLKASRNNARNLTGHLSIVSFYWNEKMKIVYSLNFGSNSHFSHISPQLGRNGEMNSMFTNYRLNIETFAAIVPLVLRERS